MTHNIHIVASSKNYQKLPCVLTIGNFDGVHVGHQQLLQKTIAIAKLRNIESCAFTFEPSPRSVLGPKTKPVRIANWVDKINWLDQIGIKNVILEPFDTAFAQHSAEWFVDEILIKRLQTQALVVGYDFHFGRARSGTIEMIRERAPHIDIFQIEPLKISDIRNSKNEQILQNISPTEIVSSSFIRNLLCSGSVEQAKVLLTRPHKIEGVVVSGMQRGRNIGFPTANLFPKTELIPESGVYAVTIRVDSEESLYQGMANLGVQPTFNGHSFQIEVHIFDFCRNIYGSVLEVFFHKRLRSEKKFSSTTDLIQQLQIDKQKSKEILC